MKRILFFTLVLCMVATSALAADVVQRFGLGFVSFRTPVGGRYWFSERVGLDITLGLDIEQREKTDPAGNLTGEKESKTGWSVWAGIPIIIHDFGDRVSFIFNPAVRYTDPGAFEGQTTTSDGDRLGKTTDLLALLEFEVFLTQDFSVSASHGLVVQIFSPELSGAKSTTDFSLVGANITQFGFHYYLPGGS